MKPTESAPADAGRTKPSVWFTVEGMKVAGLESLGSGRYECPPHVARTFLEDLGRRFGTVSSLPEDAEFLVFPSAYEFGKPPDSEDRWMTFSGRAEFAEFLMAMAEAAAKWVPEPSVPQPAPYRRVRRTAGNLFHKPKFAS